MVPKLLQVHNVQGPRRRATVLLSGNGPTGELEMKSKTSSYASFVACASQRLRESGIPEEHMAAALAAVSEPPQKTVKLSPVHRMRIATALAENGRCVVVLARGLGVRVYTLEGYQALRFASSERATRERLWERPGKSKLTKDQETLVIRLKDHAGQAGA